MTIKTKRPPKLRPCTNLFSFLPAREQDLTDEQLAQLHKRVTRQYAKRFLLNDSFTRGSEWRPSHWKTAIPFGWATLPNADGTISYELGPHGRSNP